MATKTKKKVIYKGRSIGTQWTEYCTKGYEKGHGVVMARGRHRYGKTFSGNFPPDVIDKMKRYHKKKFT